MKKPGSSYLLFMLLVTLLVEAIVADPRSNTIELTCRTEVVHNSSITVPGFISAFDIIDKEIQTSGYGAATVGSNPDANYGFSQCYGDLSSLDCTLCYAEARTVLPKCFPYNGGRIFLDGCYLRAENYSFFQEFTGPGDKVLCGNKTQKGLEFQKSARKAVLDAAAAAPEQGRYHSKSEVRVSGTTNESAYVLAECWRILDASSCRECLNNASAWMMGCLPWSEARALFTGCFMRYSDTDFLNEESGNSKESRVMLIVAILSSVAVLIIGVAVGVYTWRYRRIQKKRRGTNDMVRMAKTLYDSSLNFKYSTLEKATSSFDDANKLGQGGYGTVYKGVLPDGRVIAVKRLFLNNRYRAADFYNEVNMISTLEHKNLVRLLGCSCTGPESLLVYEFLPNKSLDCFLFDPRRGKVLEWKKRFEIIKGTAEGLVYLHENPNEDKSHISTAIAGTLGYMAPEYVARGQLTEKADVYSFGVLLLEIVTGIQNNTGITSEYSDSLVTAAWKHFQLGTTEKIFDPNFMLHGSNYNDDIKKEILWVVHVGFLCTQEEPSLRPPVSKALQMLLKKDEQLPAPTKPPYIDSRTMELSDRSHPKTTSVSIATVSSSAFFPR
ncbi:hypothetical protein NE237_020429 [Protea cynaroides]|uniref:Cysteine-rich receptor-like protein kinase 2 n=1 Tax=Protea cynaroides TaxID=273540 RepID=A0A9Q0HB66_9MAGN|nr:hypothetical protein NE237_020429 [Protea cynaroides]